MADLAEHLLCAVCIGLLNRYSQQREEDYGRAGNGSSETSSQGRRLQILPRVSGCGTLSLHGVGMEERLGHRWWQEASEEPIGAGSWPWPCQAGESGELQKLACYQERGRDSQRA